MDGGTMVAGGPGVVDAFLRLVLRRGIDSGAMVAGGPGVVDARGGRDKSRPYRGVAQADGNLLAFIIP